MRLFFLICLLLSLSSSCFALAITDEHVDPFVVRLLDRTSGFTAAAALISIAATNPHDDQIRNDWKQHQKMPDRQAAVGDILGTGGPGLIIAASQYYFDADENNYKSHLRALAYTTIATFSLKYAFGRPRPGESKNRHSFPSGHTSTAFATATALTYSYGWRAGIVCYPLAAFVGLSRLADDVHWGSDVVAGAFLGFIIARASSYEKSNLTSSQNQIVIFPVLGPSFRGAGLAFSFQ